jgi:methylated-DNA-protein-cysteine methyltransferase-like protein
VPNSYELIYEQVKCIPKGRVASYGLIAALAGNPRWARVVGYALHVNPSQSEIPCHRVVNRFGETSKAFAFGGEDIQRKVLENEGVTFGDDGRVDLKNICGEDIFDENSNCL